MKFLDLNDKKRQKTITFITEKKSLSMFISMSNVQRTQQTPESPAILLTWHAKYKGWPNPPRSHDSSLITLFLCFYRSKSVVDYMFLSLRSKVNSRPPACRTRVHSVWQAHSSGKSARLQGLGPASDSLCTLHANTRRPWCHMMGTLEPCWSTNHRRVNITIMTDLVTMTRLRWQTLPQWRG